jgi:hypothetical protein
MKAKTFENLIRKVVREEIDYALRREIKTLKEDLRDELKPTIIEHKERIVEVPNNPMPETAKNSLREKIMGKQDFKPQNFTSNNTLNDLLNQTAQGDTNTKTAMAPSITETTNPAISKVVNRDYRSLMKAIDKKKGLK